MLTGRSITIQSLLTVFLKRISLTWLLTLCETALTALVPLFIGFAIDGLLSDDTTAFVQLAALLAGLIVVAVIRRIYDTRAYGTIRVEVGQALVKRSGDMPVSRLNARLGMGRELVDFIEENVPALMVSAVQLVVSLVILYAFDPMLALSALVATAGMIGLYSLFHRLFFRLNGAHNQQTEQQVQILERKSPRAILAHFQRLRQIEVKLSDTEAVVYGLIFAVLLGFILFNLWFAATATKASTGTLFAIISYSWEFVEAALILPASLQDWSRLSEIMGRINGERPDMP
ncbi:ABC transporter six-transmembrane domain-containing protein [Coralliovum pocilloporae]|uniref:ABC transporter six-transmembrane domain-containing protein n=1 Tax=Coralliovum pocilloporae TaxID=3066369 RepID=UPI0033078ECD